MSLSSTARSYGNLNRFKRLKDSCLASPAQCFTFATIPITDNGAGFLGHSSIGHVTHPGFRGLRKKFILAKASIFLYLSERGLYH
jgi:hypothetical protein